MRRLAESQLGLAPKRAFLVVIPLLIFIVTESLKVKRKEKMPMKKNANKALIVTTNVVNNLSGNIAGCALLANVLYDLRFVEETTPSFV